MPELPEVETVARSLRARVVGRRITGVVTSGLSLRRPIDGAGLRAACVGFRFDSIDRAGKYLLLRCSGGDAVIAHLGMSGRFHFVTDANEERLPHTHVVFSLDEGGELRYVDPRRFGVITVCRQEALAASPELSVLGVDPLSADFCDERFTDALATSRRDIKQFLLDQSHVAGLGNIYVCEALHVAGISPRRRADRLGARRAHALRAAIRSVLVASVERRGTTFRDYVDANGERGGNQAHLLVYGREGQPCRCNAAIRRIVQGARSTFFCPTCQR